MIGSVSVKLARLDNGYRNIRYAGLLRPYGSAAILRDQIPKPVRDLAPKLEDINMNGYMDKHTRAPITGDNSGSALLL